MVHSTRLAAVVATAAMAVTPAAALAATHHAPAKKHSAKATCTALRRKEGAKAFDRKYGKGKSKGAMTACGKAHSKKKATRKSSRKHATTKKHVAKKK
jgi:hypothetical protein